MSQVKFISDGKDQKINTAFVVACKKSNEYQKFSIVCDLINEKVVVLSFETEELRDEEFLKLGKESLDDVMDLIAKDVLPIVQEEIQNFVTRRNEPVFIPQPVTDFGGFPGTPVPRRKPRVLPVKKKKAPAKKKK